MKKNDVRSMERYFCVSKPAFLGSACLETTLYELIEAVTEEIKPGEEHWVSLIVDHILNGKATKLDKKENRYMEV